MLHPNPNSNHHSPNLTSIKHVHLILIASLTTPLITHAQQVHLILIASLRDEADELMATLPAGELTLSGYLRLA